MEEAFTLVENAGDRQHFDALIASALADRDGNFYLITTIRSDFTLRLSELPRLEALLNSRAERYYLEPISEAGLRDVVCTPARLAGLKWDESTLPDRIVEDAASESSALPLVSNLLWLLWQQRKDNVLRAQVYKELGGVGGALAKSADELLGSLGEDGKRRARDLLLRLVRIGHNSPNTRRTITRTMALEAAGGGSEAERILSRLSGGANPENTQGSPGPRLIVVWNSGATGSSGDVDLVDLAHEALLTRWDTLRDWTQKHRDQLEAEAALEEAARHWEQAGRPRFPGLPSSSIRKRYHRARAPSELARDYLRAIRHQSGLRWGGIGVVMLLLSGIGSFVWWTNQENITVTAGAVALLTRWGLRTNGAS